MIRTASRIISLKEVISMEDEPVRDLGDEDILSSDVNIFFLRISSV